MNFSSHKLIWYIYNTYIAFKSLPSYESRQLRKTFFYWILFNHGKHSFIEYCKQNTNIQILRFSSVEITVTSAHQISARSPCIVCCACQSVLLNNSRPPFLYNVTWCMNKSDAFNTTRWRWCMHVGNRYTMFYSSYTYIHNVPQHIYIHTYIVRLLRRQQSINAISKASCMDTMHNFALASVKNKSISIVLLFWQ